MVQTFYNVRHVQLVNPETPCKKRSRRKSRPKKVSQRGHKDTPRKAHLKSAPIPCAAEGDQTYKEAQVNTSRMEEAIRNLEAPGGALGVPSA